MRSLASAVGEGVSDRPVSQHGRIRAIEIDVDGAVAPATDVLEHMGL